MLQAALGASDAVACRSILVSKLSNGIWIRPVACDMSHILKRGQPVAK